MTQNVGAIEYTVDADTGRLLDANKAVRDATSSMQRDFDKTDKSASALGTSMTRLGSIIKGVFAASALKSMAKMVQGYQEMSERVQMATSSQSEFEMVQKRLLTTANGTYRSLSEAQELYIRTADSLRSMGYSTEQAIDVQDSMSYAFVKNATSADRAAGAINAFSKSMNTGKVSADAWETITSAIPSVIDDIAKASRKTSAEIRALGASGKLTGKDLSEGLRVALDANASAAAGMSNNLTDASVRLTTAFTSVLVSLEKETGALQSFTNGLISAADAVLDFSQDSESMSGAIDAMTLATEAFAAVMIGRYVGAFASATNAKISNIAASRQLSLAEKQAAQNALYAANATQRKALADKEATASAVALAQAEYNVAKGSAAEMTALDALTAAKTRASAASLALVQAQRAQAAATATAATAARSASIAFTAMKGVMSLLGGPAGVVMLAATAIYYFWQKAQQAKEEAWSFADGLDELKSSMDSMTATQLRGAIADANDAIKIQAESLADDRKEIDELETAVGVLSGRLEAGGNIVAVLTRKYGSLSEAESLLAKRKRDLADATDKHTNSTDASQQMQDQLNSMMLANMGVTDNTIQKNNALVDIQGAVASAFGKTAAEVSKATGALQNYNPASLMVSPPSEKADEYNASLAEQNELLSITDLRLRAVTKAQKDAEKAGGNVNQIKRAGELAGITYDLRKGEEERNKSTKDGTKSANEAAEAIMSQQKALDRLNTGYKDGSVELAKYDAVVALGSKATAGQIQKAEELAEAQWRVVEALRGVGLAQTTEQKESQTYQADLKALQEALAQKKISRAQYDDAELKMEREHQIKLAQIRASASVTPEMEARGAVDPVQALANEHAKKMALIEAFYGQDATLHAQYLALKNEAERAYETERLDATWSLWAAQSEVNQMAADAIDSLGSGASSAITGLINGTQSLQEAFANIGTTILNSVVSSLVEMGIQYVKSLIMGQAQAAAGQTAAVAQGVATAAALQAAYAPAAMAASIASYGAAATTGQLAYTTAMAAARIPGLEKGGPANAGQLYRVGEKGPEIFTQGGKNYMIPGQSGSVTPNREISGAGGSTVNQTNNFTINTTGGIDDATMNDLTKRMETVSRMTIKNEQRPNGLLQKSR